MAKATENVSGEINLPMIYGELCELRGSMAARMEGVEKQLESGLGAVAEASSSHSATAAKVAALEEAELQQRVLALEGNWRLAIYVGAVLVIIVGGLAADLLRGLLGG